MTKWSLASADLTAAQVAAILKLADRAGAADGVAPLSEPVLLHLRYDGPRLGRDVVATVDGEIAAYAHLDPPAPEVSGELVVDPGRRRQGIGRALVGELAAAANGHLLQLWAHGDLPAAASLAREAGLERFRTLWQMRRSLRDPVGAPGRPPAAHLRPRPGRGRVAGSERPGVRQASGAGRLDQARFAAAGT